MTTNSNNHNNLSAAPAAQPQRPLERIPLYRLQENAFMDPASADEIAHRFVDDFGIMERSPRQRKMLVKSFLRGLNGLDTEWPHGKGYNYAAPYRTAYTRGKTLRRELIDLGVQTPRLVAAMDRAFANNLKP